MQMITWSTYFELQDDPIDNVTVTCTVIVISLIFVIIVMVSEFTITVNIVDVATISNIVTTALKY